MMLPMTTLDDFPPPEKPRRRLPRLAIVGFVLAGLIILALVADFAVGSVAKRTSCIEADGATVRPHFATMPVTSGLTTGSVGTADIVVSWDEVNKRARSNNADGQEVTMANADGKVVAKTRQLGLPVEVLMEISNKGNDIVLTPVALKVAGRDVSLDLANMFGAGDALKPRSLSGVAGDMTVKGAMSNSEGLNLTVDLPLSAIALATQTHSACS